MYIKLDDTDFIQIQNIVLSLNFVDKVCNLFVVNKASISTFLIDINFVITGNFQKSTLKNHKFITCANKYSYVASILIC